MRRWSSLLLVCLTLSAALVGGCVVNNDHSNPPPPATCDIPGPVTYTTNIQQYTVQANASTVIPGGDRGYAVTSNGTGTYRLTWTDTAGFATCFTGRITGYSDFSASQISGFSGHESIQLIAPNQIGFASVPGTDVDGVDFFNSQDPVVVDAFADGSTAVSIYYTDAFTGAVTAAGSSLAAFTAR